MIVYILDVLKNMIIGVIGASIFFFTFFVVEAIISKDYTVIEAAGELISKGKKRYESKYKKEGIKRTKKDSIEIK